MQEDVGGYTQILPDFIEGIMEFCYLQVLEPVPGQENELGGAGELQTVHRRRTLFPGPRMRGIVHPCLHFIRLQGRFYFHITEGKQGG
jgi:hypothetical protein